MESTFNFLLEKLKSLQVRCPRVLVYCQTQSMCSMTRYQCQNAVFHYGGVCFIMVGYVSCGVSLWWGMFHYGGVLFIMVGYL